MQNVMNREAAPVPEADLDHILDHTRAVWSALRRESVLITGGTGFIGRWLLEGFVHANQALDLQAQAVVLTRNPEQFAAHAPHLAANPAIQLVRGEVRSFDPADLAAAAAESVAGRIGFVIHAAAETGPQSARTAPLRVLDTLYSGTRRVLEWAAAQSVTRILLLSSGAVYGSAAPATGPLTEDFSGAPACASAFAAYAEGKRLMELLGAMFQEQHAMECKIARGFAFVGPGLPLQAHYAIGNFIHDALHRPVIEVKSDGAAVRSYLYAADLAIWLWTLLLRASPSQVYNVGSDEAVSIRAVAEAVATRAVRPLPVVLGGQAQPSAAAANYVPDIRRARQELGLEVWIPFASAVARTLQFYQTGRDHSGLLPVAA